MSTTTNQTTAGDLGLDSDYDITNKQKEALEHLAEHGKHTSDLAKQLLRLIE